jgi:tetratricopeptide (TPR) repeat protein
VTGSLLKKLLPALPEGNCGPSRPITFPIRNMEKMMKNLTANKGELHSKQILLTFLKNKKGTILPVIIVFCLPLLLYLQTLSFGLTYFDDNEIIINNITFLSNFRNAPQVFLIDAFLGKSTPLYRPLQTLSYMADMHLSGVNNTWMYHLTNILLLGLIACSLFLLFRKFLIPLKLALLSTLVYCAHPLFISSIAWIPARGDLLLSFFSLLSFLFFIEHLQKGKVIFLFLNWLTFTLALFCKETAAILPFLFIIYYFTFSSEKRFEKKYLLNIVLYAISGIFWFWLRSIATGNFTNQNGYGLTQFISNLQTIPESFANFFLPSDIALIPSFSLLKILIGLGIITMIIVLFFINKERSKKEKVFCLSWFLFLLLPTMVHKMEYIDYLNHRFFLPLIGILLFVLFILPKKWIEEKDIKRKIVVNGGFFCIFALLSSLTFIRSRSYSDPITFWNSSISQNPDNPLMYNNRGYVKDNRSDFQGAINDYTKAIELNPNFALAYYNRGNTYGSKGDLAEAIKDYDKAIELNPNDANTYYNRGNTYRMKGDLAEAIKDYDKAIELNPNFAYAYNNRGSVYNDEGNHEMAIKYYNKAIELEPNYAEAYYNRGNAFDYMGDHEMAIKDYDKAIELNPNYTVAYYNRGNAFGYMGDHEMAIKDYDKAIELNPNYAEAYTNRGLAYYIKGNVKEAIRNLDKAIELKPNFAFAYTTRGAAYYTIGYLAEAIKDYNKAIELDPNYANAYYNRGIAYKAKGMLKEAGQDFKMYEKLKKKSS